MDRVILERFAYSPIGTFGVIRYKQSTFYTVERPWMNNKAMVSCIPDGEYQLIHYASPKFGKTLAVIGGTVSLYPTKSAKRSAILIHAANTMDDLQGCIGLGTRLGFVNGKWAVVNSREAVTDFLSLFEGEDHVELIITQYLP